MSETTNSSAHPAGEPVESPPADDDLGEEDVPRAPSDPSDPPADPGEPLNPA